MKIVTGKYKGFKLFEPPQRKSILRPAQQRVREALFNIIDVSNKNFLDAFAGTGSIGFEAISNYTNSNIFIEKDRIHSDVLNKNIEKLKIDKKNNYVIKYPFETFIKLTCKNKYDLNLYFDFVFLGPPYEFWNQNWVLETLIQSDIFKKIA